MKLIQIQFLFCLLLSTSMAVGCNKTMNPGGISVKVYEIYQEMRGGQPTGIARNFANTGKDT